MPPFDAYQNQDRIKLLLLGHPKVGKTALLATLANAGYRVRILDFDNNLSIMKSYLAPDASALVDFVSLNAKDPLSWKRAKELTRKWDDGSKPTDWQNDTVLAIDSASFWSDNAVEYFRSLPPPPGKQKDPRQDFYAAQTEVENEVAYLTSQKFKCHVIFITHWRDQLSKSEEIYRTVPAFFGNILPSTVPKYCNNVWGAALKQGDKRVIKTQSTTSTEFLGSSAPKAVLSEEEFDLGKIFRKINP